MAPRAERKEAERSRRGRGVVEAAKGLPRRAASQAARSRSSGGAACAVGPRSDLDRGGKGKASGGGVAVRLGLGEVGGEGKGVGARPVGPGGPVGRPGGEGSRAPPRSRRPSPHPRPAGRTPTAVLRLARPPNRFGSGRRGGEKVGGLSREGRRRPPAAGSTPAPLGGATPCGWGRSGSWRRPVIPPPPPAGTTSRPGAAAAVGRGARAW